ncbi:MAG: hypothetical protein KDK99_02565, partial [Verrucomicrobiales bacterium]|nr:hypothetical protein [Verrucomicrobiales bacterium]
HVGGYGLRASTIVVPILVSIDPGEILDDEWDEDLSRRIAANGRSWLLSSPWPLHHREAMR